ncbi:MAG TPA: metallophosphoesterase [Flavitalea sp.]|nr:metallophosphoesterase [Flavitalea sp.]
MLRRDILKALSATSLLLPFRGQAVPQSYSNLTNGKQTRGSFAIDGNRVRFYHPDVEKNFNILMLADTHLFTDDARGEPFKQYSARMAKAYNVTKHFQTGAPTNPEESFTRALAIAGERQASMLALIGDIFSFPSEAGVEWAQEKLKAVRLPYLYTAGNHDWHYEGTEGTSQELRKTWIENRLKPMYSGTDPMFNAIEMNGITLITIDNSNYQILPEQLEFFKSRIKTGKPTLLMLHIPLYAPGRSMGFGCGSPQWGAASDKNYELERRQRWPESGHTKTTFDFHNAVFKAENLIGILAGHTHKPSLDVVNGIPQIVTDANATGAYLDVEFLAALNEK